MKKTLALACRVALAAAFIAVVVPTAASPASAPVRSIVVYDSPAVNASAMAQIERLGGVKVRDLPLVDGSVVYLPSRAAEQAVVQVAGVRYVEPDYVVEALRRPAPTPVAQTLPWGVDRVNADAVWPTYTGDPVKVAVVDTGIDTKHPDLVGNIKGGMSAVAYTTSYTDDNGHGSHVAGTIAALDNAVGVVGVAPAADLYAVKVLDRRGSGYVSDIIEGLQWAIANHMNVVNMSLGSAYYSASFDSAVQQSVAAGIVVVAAAGNSGPGDNTVGYPAGFANVIAVSATDSNNSVASFSSRGPQVDLAAPGVSIYSTYKNSSYATLSGTSMASPHVAGAVALVMTTPMGTDDLNGNGVWDPSEVAFRLKRKAQDLGATGVDNNYGYGLVRADLAVQP